MSDQQILTDPPEPAAPEQAAGLPDFTLAAPVAHQLAAAAAGPVKFFDSASHTFPPGAQYVALYFDGDYAYHGSESWPFEHWITVTGDSQAAAVIFADYEPGNPVYGISGRLRQWAERRIVSRRRAVVYCDRAELHQAHLELGPLLASHPGLLWWIPTGGDLAPGGTEEWSPAALAVDIAANWGVSIPAAKIYANQYGDGPAWDVSNLFGTWR